MSDIKKIPTISIKAVGYGAKELRKMVEEKNGEQITIATVGGVAISQYSGISKHGEWTGFKGIFVLANNKGDTFSSEAIMLPSNATKLIKEQLEKGVVEVEFKFEISVAESEKNASGYAYYCEPIKTPEMIARANSIANMVLNAGKNLLSDHSGE